MRTAIMGTAVMATPQRCNIRAPPPNKRIKTVVRIVNVVPRSGCNMIKPKVMPATNKTGSNPRLKVCIYSFFTTR